MNKVHPKFCLERPPGLVLFLQLLTLLTLSSCCVFPQTASKQQPFCSTGYSAPALPTRPPSLMGQEEECEKAFATTSLYPNRGHRNTKSIVVKTVYDWPRSWGKEGSGGGGPSFQPGLPSQSFSLPPPQVPEASSSVQSPLLHTGAEKHVGQWLWRGLMLMLVAHESDHQKQLLKSKGQILHK